MFIPHPKELFTISIDGKHGTSPRTQLGTNDLQDWPTGPDLVSGPE